MAHLRSVPCSTYQWIKREKQLIQLRLGGHPILPSVVFRAQKIRRTNTKSMFDVVVSNRIGVRVGRWYLDRPRPSYRIESNSILSMTLSRTNKKKAWKNHGPKKYNKWEFTVASADVITKIESETKVRTRSPTTSSLPTTTRTTTTTATPGPWQCTRMCRKRSLHPNRNR